MLAIVDYGAGNQTSVLRALRKLGIEALVTADRKKLVNCDGVIFPGVGAAGQAMDRLRETGLDRELRELVRMGRPLLGICLGCQILLEKSEEGPTETLGILPGQSVRFNENWTEENGRKIKIPHMGWNSLKKLRDSVLLANVPENAEFYFVHGYHVLPPSELVIATTFYGGDFCSVYGRDGLWALQFHPEKSGRYGLLILENFNRYCQEKSHAI